MNQITKTPLRNLGYDFIPAEYLPEGKDEYYLRNEQHNSFQILPSPQTG